VKLATSESNKFDGVGGRLELDQSVPDDADILDPRLSEHFYDAVPFFTHGQSG